MEKLYDGKSAFTRLVLETPVLGAFIDVEKLLSELNSATDSLGCNAFDMIRRAPLSIQAASASSLEAWRQAGLDDRSIDPERIALVVGGHNVNGFLSFQETTSARSSPYRINPRYAVEHLDTDHVGTISQILGIRGEGFTIGGASASGNLALIQAMRLLRDGSYDVCVVVGAMMHPSTVEFRAFQNLGAMAVDDGEDPDDVCRPFDETRRGFVYGQGTGCVILESNRPSSAKGVRCLAEVAGAAASLDANRLPNPSWEGELAVFQRALQSAGLSPSDIDYVNAHGSSSQLGDEAEAKALTALLGERSQDVWVNATKGLLGHCLNSAGLVEAVVTVAQMEAGRIHPNRNLVKPLTDRLRLVGTRGEDVDVRTALSASFGFGGINSALVFRKGEER